MAKFARGVFLVMSLVSAALVLCSCRVQQSSNTAPPPQKNPPAQDYSGEIDDLRARLQTLESNRNRGEQPPDQGLSAAEQLLRKEEMRKGQEAMTADVLYKTALGHFQQAEYQQAKLCLEQALSTAPEHAQAKELLREVRAMLGEHVSGDAGTIAKRLLDEQAARVDAVKVEVTNHFAQGKRYYEMEEYDKAIFELNCVTEGVKWFPYHLDLDQLNGEAQQLLAMSTEKKKEKDIELKRKQEDLVRRQVTDEETRRKMLMQEKIENLFQTAQKEFELEHYAEAEAICGDILDELPNFVEAQKFKVICNEMKHSQNERETKTRLFEEYKRTIENIDLKRVVQRDIVVFPSKEEWEKIRNRGPKGIAKRTEDVSEADRAVLTKLQTTKITLQLVTGQPLTDAISNVREFVGVNITFGAEVQDPASKTLPELEFTDLPAAQALSLLLDNAGGGLTYIVRDGVVIITTAEAAQQATVLELYDVQDLTTRITDFVAPDISLTPVTEEAPVGGADGGADAAGVVPGSDRQGLVGERRGQHRV
jgi:tetratricopeptide (TPR) repeat protein